MAQTPPAFARALRPGARRRRQRGQALVEFALVLPVFLLVLFGVIDFGVMLYSRMTVINATREGARAAVTQVDNPTAIPSVVRSAAIAASMGTLTTSDVTVTCVAYTQASCAFVSGPNPPKSGDGVKVTATYTYNSFFIRYFGPTFNLSSTIQMVIE